MGIVPEKTWEVISEEFYGEGITATNQCRIQLFNIKKCLVGGTVPWIVRLSATNLDDSNNPNKTVTGATKANPCEITIVAHGFVTGERVLMENIGGMVELNDLAYTITSTGDDTFTLDGVDSQGYTDYTTGGDCFYQDNIDRWVDSDDVQYGTGNHSWVVLEVPGIHPDGKFQVLLDYDVSNGIYIYAYVSPSGSFFKGTKSVRPTASDETQILANYNWGGNVVGNMRQVYCCKSTDGQCTRVYFGYSRTPWGMWLFDRIKNPVSGLTHPWTVLMDSSSSVPSRTEIVEQTNFWGQGDLGDPDLSTKFRGTVPVNNNAYVTSGATTYFGQGQDFTGDWYGLPVGLTYDKVGDPERIGELFDFWMVSSLNEEWLYLEDERGPWFIVKCGDDYAQPGDGTVWRKV